MTTRRAPSFRKEELKQEYSHSLRKVSGTTFKTERFSAI